MNCLEQTENKPLLLIFPLEQLAHYLRCLTLAKGAAAFFEIRFAHSQRYHAFVQQEGFKTFPCDSINADEILDCVKRFDFSWINTENLQRALHSQVAVIKTLKPALVLGDAIPTLKMAAEKTGVPYVSLMNGYMTKHYNGVRKMSWRFPLFRYFNFLPAFLFNQLTKKGEALAFQKIHQPFKELRQQHGLLKKWTYPDEQEGDLNLVCDLPELFPQQTLPPNYVLIPPLIYEPAIETDAIANRLNPHKRTLFVSMGSTGNWESVSFLNAADLQKYNIVTAGDKAGIVQGAHIIRADFANPEPLFRRVDLVLCHGGNGTLYQALRYGIPLLCKTAHFEQEWNVHALQKAKLGASLDAVKKEADYIKLIDTWIGKKGSPPLAFIQEKIRVASGFERAISHMLELIPAEKRIYYKSEKKSA